MKFEFIDGVKKNNCTGGVCAHIRTEDAEHYYADLSDTPDRGIEFMIFPADAIGRVTDWGELYSSYPAEISEQAFVECVVDWIRRKER